MVSVMRTVIIMLFVLLAYTWLGDLVEGGLELLREVVPRAKGA